VLDSLPTSQPRVILALRTGDDHLSAREDQRRRLGISDSHDDGGESFGVVLCVSGMERDRLEVESAVEVHGRDNVSAMAKAVGDVE
jgi:hypothetical protein